MIRIYDFSYNLLCETEMFFSSEWELKFNGIGTYEGNFPIDSHLAGIFAENRYLILCDGDRQAICTGKLIADKVSVYGRTPEWLLSKRVVLPFKTSQIFGEQFTDPETVLLYLLTNSYKTPTTIDESGNDTGVVNERAIAQDLILPEPVGAEVFDRHFWRNSANPLSDVVADLCDIMGCGHTLRFFPDEKCWKFSLVFAKERNLLISKSLKNSYDMSMKDSLLEKCDSGYFEVYSSENEDSAYACTRVEDSQSSGMLYWEAVLNSASGLSESRNVLAKKNNDIRLECELLGISYGVDYELGDIIRVQFEAGPFRKTFNRRVKSVSIISSKRENSIKPVFGEI